jgi:hypothetical protein
VDQKAARAQIAKVLKAHGFKARKGHLRRESGELFWYADVRAAGPSPTAALTLEVGCWSAACGPEPEGGAVDCPLLADLPVGDDPDGAALQVATLAGEIDRLDSLPDLLAGDRLPGALVDRSLRSLLDG